MTAVPISATRSGPIRQPTAWREPVRGLVVAAVAVDVAAGPAATSGPFADVSIGVAADVERFVFLPAGGDTDGGTAAACANAELPPSGAKVNSAAAASATGTGLRRASV